MCFYYRSLCFVCRLYFFCRFCLCRLFSHTQNKHRPIHTYVCAYVGLESWIGRRRSTEWCREYGRARRNRVIHLLIGNSWGILTFSGLFLVCPLLRVPLPPSSTIITLLLFRTCLSFAPPFQAGAPCSGSVFSLPTWSPVFLVSCVSFCFTRLLFPVFIRVFLWFIRSCFSFVTPSVASNLHNFV